ncbi:hypothetical protein [Bacillus sp. MUM 13]|uniref:hypothetical protein n=1 Tax=Bacillus sp. MUM 13 TaxID=1678001 RepID=UPI0008F56460|nr:hypothetical protein [Bacillus sp. MUM 13]OIK13345.1 hypothetical protein BIV59_06195 [Bacillus sp. MUM 13]
MSKKRFTLYTAIIVITVLAFLYFRPYSEKLTKSANLSKESIGGMKIHESILEGSFITRYGKPLSQENNDYYDYYHWKGGLETASINSGKNKGSLMRLIISGTENNLYDNPLRTEKGIKLGDSKEKVLSLYGENYYKSNEQGADIIGYIDHKHHLTLEFWCVSDGKVAKIQLDDASVE